MVWKYREHSSIVRGSVNHGSLGTGDAAGKVL